MSSTPVSSDTRTQVIQAYLDHPTYNCSKCSAVIALQDETITKLFQGRDGRGFLMHSAVNLKLGSREDRSLITGVHTVADCFCMGCNERMGWFYHKASDFSQKYKEGKLVRGSAGCRRQQRAKEDRIRIANRLNAGKYLLEREKLVKENAWTLDASPS